MGYLRIHCDYCGGTWEVYGRDDWNDDRARQCPHCSAKIDRQDWTKEVLPAFAAMMDANREIAKTHSGYHIPLFTVDYIEDSYYPKSLRSIETAVFNLQNTIEDLTDKINDYTDGKNSDIVRDPNK